MKRWIYFIFVNLFLMPQTVFGHARWANVVSALPNGQTIVPRSTNNDAVKIAPCGGFNRSATFPTLRPGQAVNLNWIETVNHPGFFRVYFSAAGDTNFQLLGEMQDNANGPLPHNFNMTLTMPNVECEQCTLQLIQYMTENNPPSLYYSCADIRLSNSAAPNPTPSPSSNAGPSLEGDTRSAQEILRACGGGTKVSSINASMSFALLLPVAGLLRRRKK